MSTNDQIIEATDTAVQALQDLRTQLVALIDGMDYTGPDSVDTYEKARAMLADTELALSTLAGRHRSEHTFRAKRVPGEGYQAGCVCTWTGGMVERSISQAEDVFYRYHFQRQG